MPATALRTLELPDLSGLAACSDAELTAAVRVLGEARRVVDAEIAKAADEVARRSSHERGYDGLAQRSGARTPDELLSRLTGTSGPEAKSMVAVGSMLADPAPWLAEVATAVAAGDVSVGAAAAIEKGLGAPSATVAADDLADAAHLLAVESKSMAPERVARLARDLRDELDAGGVEDRERLLHSKRFLKLIPQADGMTRIAGLLDPESAATVVGAIDAVTSPRRGGPRFVDPVDQARAQAIIDDPRTTEQLALDAFVEMVRIAVAADDGRVFGVSRPAVRVHVTLADLDRRRTDGARDGFGHVEGQAASVSLATVERISCASGYLPILFDACGVPLNLGRSQRLFSRNQRLVLAAMWGGCAVDGCDRPPSWTEAHHIDEWAAHRGETNVVDGVLLCKHHHMLLHQRRWRIRRRGNEYEVIAAPGSDEVVPIRLESKNPIRRRSALPPNTR